jgi:ferredoxin
VKVRVDESRCNGHARCFATAPELYTIDDLGYSSVTELDVPAALEEAARLGAEACPERAITVEE